MSLAGYSLTSSVFWEEDAVFVFCHVSGNNFHSVRVTQRE